MRFPRRRAKIGRNLFRRFGPAKASPHSPGGQNFSVPPGTLREAGRTRKGGKFGSREKDCQANGGRGGSIKDAPEKRYGYRAKNGSSPGRTRYWLIARRTEAGDEVLVTGPEHAESLPVFSFPEEAEMFLRFELPEGVWRVREATPEECLSLLSGPYAHVTSVALDPLPDMVACEMLGLVNVSRREFVGRLLDRKSLAGV